MKKIFTTTRTITIAIVRFFLYGTEMKPGKTYVVWDASGMPHK